MQLIAEFGYRKFRGRLCGVPSWIMKTKRLESDLSADCTVSSSQDTIDCAYQALAVVLKCAQCECDGFQLGATSSATSLTRHDIAQLTGVSKTDTNCVACQHAMNCHLEALHSVDSDERDLRINLLRDYVFLSNYVEKYSSNDELQLLRGTVFPILRGIFRSSPVAESTNLAILSRSELQFKSPSVRKMLCALMRNLSTLKHFQSLGSPELGRIPDEIFNAATAQFERNAKRRKFDETSGNSKDMIDQTMKSIAEREAEENKISVHVIMNNLDGMQSHRKLSWLMQLQRLFCAQLPKMPEEYVTRVVYDRDHRSLVIHKEGKGIIGGICFRSFQQQGFIEIVFCAITADEQVKGYGTLMMNHLKDYQINNCGLFHFLTYADEFAIGYFKKQGFITQIALPIEQFRGYIKDYQGATLMGCQLHPRIIYTKQKELFYNMREFYSCLIKVKRPTTETKFGGIEHIFQEHDRTVLNDSQIPGFASIRDSSSCSELRPSTAADPMAVYRAVLSKLRNDKNAWPFLAPVNADEVPEYYETIGYPIDLRTMSERLKAGYYVHERLFLADAKRMFANCYKFNAPDSPYYMHGYKLNRTFNQLAETYFPGADVHTQLPPQQPVATATEGKAKKH